MAGNNILDLTQIRNEIKGVLYPRCNSCILEIHDRIDVCFTGCFDNIVQEALLRNSQISIINAVSSQKSIDETIKKILNIILKPNNNINY